jgi:hypothetical protein
MKGHLLGDRTVAALKDLLRRQGRAARNTILRRGGGAHAPLALPKLAKTLEPIGHDTSGRAALYRGEQGSETDSQRELTVWNKFEPLSADQWITVVHTGAGWYVTGRPNPATLLVMFRLTSDLPLGGSGSARVERWNNTDWEDDPDQEPITVYDSRRIAFDATVDDLGVAWFNTSSSRHEVITIKQFPYVPFYLNANLAEGGTASAQRLEFDGANWSPGAEAITVDDSFLRLGPAAAQTRGLALRLNVTSFGGADHYFVTQLDSAATQLIMFRLSADIAIRGSAAATVIQSWDDVAGEWIDGQADPIEVFDSRGLGPARQEDLGIAWLNLESGRYEIITLPRTTIGFELYNNLSRGGTANASLLDWGNWASSGTADILVDDSFLKLGPAGAGRRGVALVLPDPLGGQQYFVLGLDQSNGHDFCFFQLQAPLSRGGQAAAKKYQAVNQGGTWQYQLSSQTITVHDDSNYEGPAPAGIEGWAWLDPTMDDGRWQVIKLFQERLRLVKLADNLQRGGQADADLYNWDEISSDWEVERQITVTDPAQIGPMPTDRFAWALYSYRSKRYELVSPRDVSLEQVRFDGELAKGETGDPVPFRFRRWDDQAADWITTAETGEAFDPARQGPVQDGDRGWVMYDQAAAAYVIVSVERAGVYWARATQNWTNVSGNGSFVACETVADRDGAPLANPRSVTVYLPRHGFGDPNVRTNDVIGYQVDDQGEAICVTDYMDDKIGTIKMWSGDPQQVGRGWRIYATATGRFPVGVVTDDPDIPAVAPGATGGLKKHKHKYREQGIKTDPTELTIDDHPSFYTAGTSLSIPPVDNVVTSTVSLTVGTSPPVEATISGTTESVDLHVYPHADYETLPTALQVLHSGEPIVTSATDLIVQAAGSTSATGTITGSGTIPTTAVAQETSVLEHADHYHTVSISPGAPYNVGSTYTPAAPNSYGTSGHIDVGTGATGPQYHQVINPLHSHQVNASQIAQNLSIGNITIPGHTHEIAPNPHYHFVILPPLTIYPSPHVHGLPTLEHTLVPNPHYHLFENASVTIPGHTHDIAPNPHYHFVTLPTLTIDPNPHDHWVPSLPHVLNPNPHRHDLPDSPEELHIPPFFGVYFIERFE